jgi:uncharacterized Tic20 family protein
MSQDYHQPPYPAPPPAPNYYAPPQGYGLSQESKTMAMLCHLLGLFTGFVGPLIIWLIKKDEDPFVRDQGAQSLNFQFTTLIMYFVSFVLCFVFIGFLLLPAVFISHLVFGIIASVKAGNGEAYRYPIAIPFIS